MCVRPLFVPIDGRDCLLVRSLHSYVLFSSGFNGIVQGGQDGRSRTVVLTIRVDDGLEVHLESCIILVYYEELGDDFVNYFGFDRM